MRPARAFFSFTELADPSTHRAYNEWHQLDHRPENLALPGVIAGERWVRSPSCVAGGIAVEPLDRLHYLNMYWFAEPAERSIAAWQELAERSFQWGRRTDVHIATRLMMGFFRPISGWVSPRVRVSLEALAFRPNRGVHVMMSTIADPRSPAAERHLGALERDYIPAQLARPGVAGCWTFAGESNFSSHADMSADDPPPSTHITVFYLDDDPVEVSASMDPVRSDDVAELVLSSPLLAITPWEWDWFD